MKVREKIRIDLRSPHARQPECGDDKDDAKKDPTPIQTRLRHRERSLHDRAEPLVVKRKFTLRRGNGRITNPSRYPNHGRNGDHKTRDHDRRHRRDPTELSHRNHVRNRQCREADGGRRTRPENRPAVFAHATDDAVANRLPGLSATLDAHPQMQRRRHRDDRDDG